MATVYMMVGLPASGKSTWVKNNKDKLDAHVLSSDEIREEWFGDASIQKNPAEIFDYIHKTAKTLLTVGENVIIDATNISQKRRIHFNKEFKDFKRVAVYFNTSIETCYTRDMRRDRSVEMKVINKMYRSLQVPTYSEGWDDIQVVYEEYVIPFENKDFFESMLADKLSHEGIFNNQHLGMFYEFSKVFNMPQDNPHHTFSISRHIYYVYEYIFNNYHPKIVVDDKTVDRDFIMLEDYDSRFKMLWVAMLHDVGKGFTKQFKNHKGETTRYAHFYGHENVSAQIAVAILHALGYTDKFILEVAEIVQLHMKLLNGTKKTEDKIRRTFGENVLNELLLFREADTSAK